MIDFARQSILKIWCPDRRHGPGVHPVVPVQPVHHQQGELHQAADTGHWAQAGSRELWCGRDRGGDDGCGAGHGHQGKVFIWQKYIICKPISFLFEFELKHLNIEHTFDLDFLVF